MTYLKKIAPIATAIALLFTYNLTSQSELRAETTQQQPKRLHVDWISFQQDTELLAQKLKSMGPWKGMIAITRGGLVPAALLSHELNIRKIDTISIASYGEDDTQRDLKIFKTSAEAGDGTGWLIVDDLSDSGATSQKARKLLPNAHVAVVYTKPKGAPSVDTYVKEVDQDTWIVFPWEEKV